MPDTTTKYSDEDLQEFKEIILKKIERAEEDLALLQSSYKNGLNNGTDDTSPQFKSFEEGSETMSKEANVPRVCFFILFRGFFEGDKLDTDIVVSFC